MAELHFQDKPSTNPSEKSNTSLLSLTDDIISRIFEHIAPNMKHTLQSSADAINLGITNKRLHHIFSTGLKKITPLLHHLHADTLSEQHLAVLINHAGANLRELHVPSYMHRYVPYLPDICPNIEVLHMFNNLDHTFSGKNPDKQRNDMSHVVAILARLNLRKLTITDPPKEIYDVLRNHMPEELHLCRVDTSSLPQLLPLLSSPLKALTVIIYNLAPPYDIFKDFIDSLCKAVPNIQSLTIHASQTRSFAPYDVNPLGNPPDKFMDEVVPFITSVRERNPTNSKCTSIDLRGIKSLSLLAAVNRNAVIMVSEGTLTLRDEVGTGIYITSLALDNSFHDQDVTRLERAFLFKSEEEPAYWMNPFLINHLKNHRLRVVRAFVAEALNHLKLSTEILELNVRIVPDVTDWKILFGVRELYLLEPGCLMLNGYKKLFRILRALPSMVDAFHGDLIWIENTLGISCYGSPDPLRMEQDAITALEAVNRFIMRGGDAATLQTWLRMVARTSRSF